MNGAGRPPAEDAERQFRDSRCQDNGALIGRGRGGAQLRRGAGRWGRRAGPRDKGRGAAHRRMEGGRAPSQSPKDKRKASRMEPDQGRGDRDQIPLRPGSPTHPPTSTHRKPW